MGGLANILNSLLEVLGIHLEAGQAAAFALLVFLLLLPWIWRSQRGDEAVRILKRASQERRVEREKMEARAMEIVSKNPNGLWLVAQEALRQGRPTLARAAVGRLQEMGKLQAEVQRFLIQLDGEPPKTAEEAGLKAEKLLGAGQVEEAERLIRLGRSKWPDSPVWAEVDARRAAPTTETPLSE